MDYKRARKLSNILALAGVGFVLLTLLLEVSVALSIALGTVGLILIGVGVVIIYVNYRCPHCHSLLPTRSISNPTYCPSCGRKLKLQD